MSSPRGQGRKGERGKLLLLLLLRAGPRHHLVLHRKARKQQRKHTLRALSCCLEAKSWFSPARQVVGICFLEGAV